MGKRLQTWYRKVWTKVFGVGSWKGATETWSPARSTARAGESGDFIEMEILRAFDRIVEELEEKPVWLADFEAKTQFLQARLDWDKKYVQLGTDTGNYTTAEVRALNYGLAIA